MASEKYLGRNTSSVFLNTHLFSQDLNYKLLNDINYSDAGDYGKVYLSYKFTSILDTDGQGEFI